VLNRIFLAAASAALLATAANAADMYTAPAIAAGYKDGPAYVGVNWSGFYAGIDGGYGYVEKTSSGQGGIGGGLGGGQAGYDFQSGSYVFGVEADFQGSDITKGGGLPVFNYSGTIRGRAGFAFDRALLYATGGFSYGGCSGDCPPRHTGWVGGAGVEYKLASDWSVKAEYQHLELSDFPYVSGDHTDTDTVRAGLNYHFGGSDVPLK